jgi:outer membrane autotransporter protein
MTIGMALSAVNSEVNYKDFKSGDKTTINSFLFSFYGTQQFTNNLFAQSVLTLGTNNVKNKEKRRITSTEFATAEGKYDTMSLSAEMLAGYDHYINNRFVVTPMAGFAYNRVNGGSYDETGNTSQLLSVTAKASQKFDLIGGAKVTVMPIVAANGLVFTPEVHAFVRHDLIGKAAQVDAKIKGLAIANVKTKVQRTFGNIGASLNTSYNFMDYTVSADTNFADKYSSIQGSVKVRVNF